MSRRLCQCLLLGCGFALLLFDHDDMAMNCFIGATVIEALRRDQ